MAIEHLRVQGASRQLDAYLARPVGGTGPRPAVIVVHEIFGPDAHIQAVAERFASAGYVALAPNLFTGEIQSQLTPTAVAAGMAFLRGLPAEVQRDPAQIQERIRALPPEEQRLHGALRQIQDPARLAEFSEDLVRVAQFLRTQKYVDATKVLGLGFCFGGGMAARLATSDPLLAGSVIFYGNPPPEADIPRIRCPIMGLYGAEDRRITDTVPKLAEDLQRAGVSFAYTIYPGAGHAFFNDSRPTMYNATAAADAWSRVLGFFRSVGAE
jgi:carboxymethylenebutenolidase